MWNQLTVLAIILNYIVAGARAAPSDATTLNFLSRVKRNDSNSSVIPLIETLIEEDSNSNTDVEMERAARELLLGLWKLRPLVMSVVVPAIVAGLIDLMNDSNIRHIPVRPVMRPATQLPMLGGMPLGSMGPGPGGVAPGFMAPGVLAPGTITPGTITPGVVAFRGGNNAEDINIAMGMLSKMVMDIISNLNTPQNGKEGKYLES